MRHNLLTHCQIKIAYSWRKYIKIKKAKLAKEAERKRKRQLALAKKGKKSKKKGAPKKSVTLKPLESTNLFKQTKSDMELEPGQQPPGVNITVEGKDLEPVEDEGEGADRPDSQKSHESRGATVERGSRAEDNGNKSEEDEGLKRRASQDEDGVGDVLDR